MLVMESKQATPKSARKRIIFSGSPNGDSSDSSLGPISPLSKSSEHYSSPPSSPNWVFETPRKSTVRIKSTLFGPVSCPLQFSESKPSDAFEVLTQASSDEILRNVVDETTIIDTEIVAETPSKDSEDRGFATPFKCLVRKSLQHTPRRKRQEASNAESNVLTPVKVFPKLKAQERNNENKASSPLPPITFYGSRARTSLFPRRSISAERVNTPQCNGAKRKCMFHSEIKHGGNHISRHSSISKRLKVGEINVGVRHAVRKSKLKTNKVKSDTKKLPKVTPSQRIESYVSNVLSSIQQCTEPEIDPMKRFFKTKRPLQINEKGSTHKSNSKKITSSGSSAVKKNTAFDEKSSTEIVQKKVQNDVKVLLRQLEESPEKETSDVQNQHISAITSHTSSLALNDSGPWRQELLCFKDFKQNLENVAPLVGQMKMVTNVRKYFPVFDKNHGSKKGLEGYELGFLKSYCYRQYVENP